MNAMVGSSSRTCWFHHLTFFRLALVFLGMLIILPLINYHFLNNFNDKCKNNGITRHKAFECVDGDEKRISDLQSRVHELLDIKASVGNELRDMENRHHNLQTEIAGYSLHVGNLKSQYVMLKKDVAQLQLSLDQLKFEREEMLSYMPRIHAPIHISMDTLPSIELPPRPSRLCVMDSCFDYSRCSLISNFSVFFYEPYCAGMGTPQAEASIQRLLRQWISHSRHMTRDPAVACLFVVPIIHQIPGLRSVTNLQHHLRSLKHWNNDGQNHLLLLISSAPLSGDYFTGVDIGRAFVAQPGFASPSLRDGFDFVVPPCLRHADGDVWQDLPLMSPARRRYLVSFQGEVGLVAETGKDGRQSEVRQRSDAGIPSAQAAGFVFADLASSVAMRLKDLKASLSDLAIIEVSCGGKLPPSGHGVDWILCGSSEDRQRLLAQSTFTILPSPFNGSASTVSFQTRLYEAIKMGAVPVIVGDAVRLPFEELLTWERVLLRLPLARITEVSFYLRTFDDASIFEMRRRGRLLWESYFSDPGRIVETALAVVRTRLQVPAPPLTGERPANIFVSSVSSAKVYPVHTSDTDEVLGPIEARFPSETFRFNYSMRAVLDVFNEPGDPFHLFPFSPFDPVLPSEAKFVGSPYGFRPIGRGAGGSGKEFGQSLGGNRPREQFTVVLLTYQRQTVLLESIQRLKGLPFLNKVIVVWNHPDLPSPDVRWPAIGVPVEVLRMSRNSLNNRFLPFDGIETEAILSMDDDVYLRHDEIVFGFRVWRGERDRIVGFPGRFHAWDAKFQSWLYNSNYSCELSMVLTGAAFFHKYYAYLYSYRMPMAIRDMVDRYTNCEDIAMNFLVSHVTRKPPVKVTSRWTFRCPGCLTTLSGNSTHFEERHKCVNFFFQVYGYMPLLYTQYRVDSVLYKTRISHDKEKCFKFI